MNNVPQHPCANKCTEFKDEPCHTCLVEKIGVKQWYDIPRHHMHEQSFLKGDVVAYMNHIPITDLEIVNECKRFNFYEFESGRYAHELDIRTASATELLLKRRLTDAEQALAEVS